MECVENIIEKLGEHGYIAIDIDNKVDMTNADKMMQFISARESGEQAEAIVFQMYLMPVSYHLNNMFITNWNEDN